MLPTHKQPGRKPIRRRARTHAKENQIRNRKFGTLIPIFAIVATRINRMPASGSKVALEKFLGDRGFGQEQCSELRDQVQGMATVALTEVLEQPPRRALSRKDEALILKKVRAFLAAIEEAKEAGII